MILFFCSWIYGEIMKKIMLLGVSLLFFQMEGGMATSENGTYRGAVAFLQEHEMERQIQRLVRNTHRFLALRRFTAYNNPPSNVCDKLMGVEQCFFVLFHKFLGNASCASGSKDFTEDAKEAFGKFSKIEVPHRGKRFYDPSSTLPTVSFCSSEIKKLQGDFSKVYDFIPSIQAVFKSIMRSNNLLLAMYNSREETEVEVALRNISIFIDKVNAAIEAGLRELALDWINSAGLSNVVNNEEQTKILDFLRGDGNSSLDGDKSKAICVIRGLNEVKFINFLSDDHADLNEKDKKKIANLKRLKELGALSKDGICDSLLENDGKVFDQFLRTIRSTIPLQILTDVKESKEDSKISNIQLENAKGGTHYRPLTNCLKINLKNASGYFPTPFHFEGATPDGTGQFLFDPSEFGMGTAHLLYHEGGHALTEAFNTIFEILENEEETNESPVSLVVGKKNNDEESDTMRAAACMFSGDTTVKISSFIEELSKGRDRLITDKRSKYRGKLWQDAYRDIRASNEKWRRFPADLKDIPNFFERLIYLDKKISKGVKENGQYIEEKISSNKIDKGKIAKLLLSENREVMQILGFRIHNGVLYVNGLSDFALFAGQRLPVNMVHQNIYGAVKREGLLDKPIDEKLSLLLEHPTYFIEFKTKMNQKFLSALFSLYGDKMDSYMSGMKNRIERGK